MKSAALPRFLFVSFLILLHINIISAQTVISPGVQHCAEKRIKAGAVPITFTSNSTPQHSYDVLNYTLNLDLYSCFASPYSKAFKGSNTITFLVDSVLSAITLDAVKSSIVFDSVSLQGKSFLQATNTASITLDKSHAVGDTVAVKIYYHHLNVSDNAFYATSGFVFTDCEPEGARYWFPCWDKPSDKATTDITAKVPKAAKLGSNGSLKDTVKSSDSTWYHWVSRDPMSTYLMAITAKSGYNLDIVYWKKPSNPSDSIPLFFYWNTGESSTNLSSMKTKVPLMATYYSSLFGEHPFEKNGFATLNSSFTSGGMENQTLTSLCADCWDETTVSHEFSHQWFGDMITCGTWADLWLNEGFATYIESLWLEHYYSTTKYKSDLASKASYYLSNNPGFAIYNPDWAITTPDINTLFDVAITYDKGGCVLHMLRYVLGDTVFFSALKSYAADTDFRFKNILTSDFVQKMNTVTGQDLTWFFNEWVYSANHPTYTNTYSITSVGTNSWLVKFTAKQTQSSPSFFQMPLEIKIGFSNSTDTTIRVSNTSNGQIFSWNFSKQPTSVTFDPNSNILLKTATLSLVSDVEEISAPVHSYQMEQNYPNPFNPTTRITYTLGAGEDVLIRVYDVMGHELRTLVKEHQPEGVHEIQFSGEDLPSGAYYYQIRAGSFSQTKKMMLLK